MNGVPGELAAGRNGCLILRNLPGKVQGKLAEMPPEYLGKWPGLLSGKWSGTAVP
jgi:hypothetical protein